MSSEGSASPPANLPLWSALRSADPVASLVAVVKAWKAAGCAQAEAERRLTAFLEDVRTNGESGEDDPVMDVLDFVVGYCSPSVKIFP
jgi:hypothetical protein